MKGFIGGTLALVALYVVVQPGTVDKATGGLGLLSAGLNRWLSPAVAGIPNKA